MINTLYCYELLHLTAMVANVNSDFKVNTVEYNLLSSTLKGNCTLLQPHTKVKSNKANK